VQQPAPYGAPPAAPGWQPPPQSYQQPAPPAWQPPQQDPRAPQAPQTFQPVPGAPPAGPQHQPSPAPSGYGPTAAVPVVPHQPAHDWRPPAPAERPRSVVGPGAPVRIEAALGAHSPTNFYKGLSGNDVIEAGGLFVATYQVPPIGTQVALKVALPGGYEFEAIGVVRWARETHAANSEAPPGFGAELVQITPEARELVHRYVRNREPLFHDDV
jgi:hypothetical protein